VGRLRLVAALGKAGGGIFAHVIGDDQQDVGQGRRGVFDDRFGLTAANKGKAKEGEELFHRDDSHRPIFSGLA